MAVLVLDDRIVISLCVVFLAQLKVIDDGRNPQARKNSQLMVKTRQFFLVLSMLVKNMIDYHSCVNNFSHVEIVMLSVKLEIYRILIQLEMSLLKLVMRDSL